MQKEADGITYSFLPALGEMEMLLYRAMKAVVPGESKDKNIMDSPESIKAIDECIDSMLVGWSSARTDIPKYPENKKPSACFRVAEKVEILGMLCDLNTIGEPERKN